MKFRTFLLFVCMIVVPLLAMFSHKVPPEIRVACSDLLLSPAIGLIEEVTSAVELKPTPLPVDFTAPPVGPLLASSPPNARQNSTESPSQFTKDAPTQVVAAPAALTVGSPTPAPPLAAGLKDTIAPASNSTEYGKLRHQLAAAGVHRLILESTDDDHGKFHGSCRVAVDPSGELQRLFHTHAASEIEALQKLLEQVTQWQQRIATRPVGSEPPQAVLR